MSEGYILLFHFDPPYKHAKHCFDFTTDIEARLRAHESGASFFPLFSAARAHGSFANLIRKWNGTRAQLFALRKQGNAGKYCPICRAERKRRRKSDELQRENDSGV